MTTKTTTNENTDADPERRDDLPILGRDRDLAFLPIGQIIPSDANPRGEAAYASPQSIRASPLDRAPRRAAAARGAALRAWPVPPDRGPPPPRRGHRSGREGATRDHRPSDLSDRRADPDVADPRASRGLDGRRAAAGDSAPPGRARLTHRR